MLDILKQLISCRSDTSEVAAMEWVQTYIAHAGRNVSVTKQFLPGTSRYNLIVANTDAPKLLLAGHMDTVPVVSAQQLLPLEKDGKLYGRGAVDMKSGIAILLYIFPQLLAKNIPCMLLLDNRNLNKLVREFNM